MNNRAEIRDRKEIENQADATFSTPVGKATVQKLCLEVLLDIRDTLLRMEMNSSTPKWGPKL